MKHLTAAALLLLSTIADVSAQQPRPSPSPAPPAQPRVTDQDRMIHAQRAVSAISEVSRLVRAFSDAIQAPDHIRWFCVVESTNKMNEIRRGQQDHPFFMHSNTGFFANEAGEMILRWRVAYEVSEQQICLANAMRAIRDSPSINVPLVAPP